MDLGMVGLGRMGANMAERLVRAGHRVVGYARSEASRQRARQAGAEAAASLAELAERLAAPRVVWLMLPAGPTVDDTLQALAPLLARGDVVVDGGNSYYRDTLRRAEWLTSRGLEFVDVGTSGGIWGRTEGYCLMVGGTAEAVARLRPVLEALAPSPDRGWGHVGPHGAGHFVKMVHNGIEYGMMQALAEGFALMRRKREFALDLHQVAEIWRHGSVVRSWLLDLLAAALAEDQEFADVAPQVADSGEGRWTVQEAIDLESPAPVITLALVQRLRSRDAYAYADRLLAVLRRQFGGHEVTRAT
ncbi:MAG: decarboxylating 6-phosphogluconate dehydrogenase [Armatimonadota bacterium]|nr:decarboxylating 6-phosphogluconate dehydrogenase [Armatimonadota bacterium]MDR7436242.1 decarboxylating 6-phosphogluconate dehydrogenase [Armatimonadota bacterium]MDR7471378.1 decarboxylating 6-phosphogluconate dehydrogenase [Armatimonadota bacterium]MDR7506410.1 decarboxylating 6-phosphogluconate dehydrogenase [Armatimonadota bacterium]MDR7508965.1 decarboxylating 6-phosphogluconate dehydrogenase [Armatimonadota bacterium]